MINSAYAKGNGAYEQYQSTHTVVQHTSAPPNPAAFDLTDGEFSTVEISLCVFVVIVALICVYRAMFSSTKQKDE